MVNKSFEVLYNHNVIRNVTEYQYLGNIVDSHLALTDDFENKYKKASGRVRLLITMRPYLSSLGASNVYNMMVTPLLTYCGIINLKHTKSQLDKFISIDKRARAIVNDNAIKIPSSIEKQIYKRACILVRKSIDYVLCDNFENYFTINKHAKETRNHLLLLTLPKVKLEFSRKSFYFYGAKLYNELPNAIRSEKSFSSIITKLVDHFS